MTAPFAPLPFLLVLAFGIGIGATIARIPHVVDRLHQRMTADHTDTTVARFIGPRLHLIQGDPDLGRGHCRRLAAPTPRDPAVRLYDFDAEGGGGAA